ncbi:MAG: protein kinase [Pseudomonadota bacterium]
MTDPRPGDAFQPGDVLNNTYRIEKLLGRGGTSEVYRARNVISKRLAAIKVLKSEFSGNDDFLVLMTREEEIREIRHDAIVRYSENHRTSEGLVYLVMDYIDGPGLDARLKEGPMTPDDLITICRQVGDGLRVAHARSIVHRDLSPDNIILRDNDPAQAVVIDFGIAKDTNPGAETIVGNEFAGKYAYAAPEQLSGQTDARSDIYSLGALLLANFRGKSPEIGANPMEVVQNKAKPLNTNGVPEPLKSLIDRMTRPDPAARFQSMAEVLGYLDGDTGGTQDALSDATVIATPPQKLTIETPQTAQKRKTKEKTSGVSGGLIAVGVAAVLIGGGAAAYLGGFIGGGGPAYPPVDPFSLIIRNLDNFDVAATGYVPSETMQGALLTRMEELGGYADVTLASGEIAPSWGTDVLSVLDDITLLDSFEFTLRNNVAAVTGTSDDAAIIAALNGKYPASWPGALSGTIDLVLTNVFLSAADVEALLDQFADCGPLTQLSDPGPVGYGPTDRIRIGGALAGEASRDALARALRSLAEGRGVSVETEQLNETLCVVENYLPEAPEGDLNITFGDGDTGQPVTSGQFYVGQNPVIDIMIPADVVDGYLTVSVLDVSGNVFHLLPNVGRSENNVATLRDGRTGEIPLRVAFGLTEDRPPGGIAFTIDNSSLGKTKILVLHSSKPLFPEMRPTTESAVSYAEALANRAVDNDLEIRSLDSQILTTAER